MPDRSDKYVELEAQEGRGAVAFLSKSRVKQWLQNPEHFRLKYLEGFAEKENAAMDRGTRIHEAIEHYYYEAIDQYETTGLIPGVLPEYLPDDRTMWADFMPRLAKFFEWEHERIERAPSAEAWRPVSLEEEHWRHDVDGLPWEGTTDLIVDASSVEPFGNDGVVIVDFKTGKTPDEQYRAPAGIYTELAFYEMLFSDEYEVAGSAALYLKAGDFVARPPDPDHFEMVYEALDEINEALDGYNGEHFETNPGPLCCWGTEPDERSKFYGICPCDWARCIDNEEKFRELVATGLGNHIIADELDTSIDAVSYWRYKLNL